MALEHWLFYLYPISAALSLIQYHVIASYHNSKPLGMQSLLGQVIVVFTMAARFTAICIGTLYSIPETFGPLGETLSSGLVIIQYITIVTFQMALLSVTFTKYISVYFSTLISELNEEVVLPSIQMAILTFPSILALLEFKIFTDIRATDAYLMFHTGERQYTANLGLGMILITMINFLAAIALQMHIEYVNATNREIGYIEYLRRRMSFSQDLHMQTIHNVSSFSLHNLNVNNHNNHENISAINVPDPVHIIDLENSNNSGDNPSINPDDSVSINNTVYSAVNNVAIMDNNLEQSVSEATSTSTTGSIGYKIHVTRIIFGMSLLLLLIFSYSVLLQKVSHRLGIFVFYNIIGNVCPAILIGYHKKIRAFAINLFSKITTNFCSL